jgi:hypothetical protein
MKEVIFRFTNEEIYKKGIDSLIKTFKDDKINTLEETDTQIIITINEL